MNLDGQPKKTDLFEKLNVLCLLYFLVILYENFFLQLNLLMKYLFEFENSRKSFLMKYYDLFEKYLMYVNCLFCLLMLKKYYQSLYVY